MAKDSVRQIEALYALAYEKITQENHHDAACLLRLMLHLAPTDERAWLGLGLCHEREGQLEMAGQLYASGVLASAASGRCALACARVLDRRGNEAEARDLYERAVAAFELRGDDEMARTARIELETRS